MVEQALPALIILAGGLLLSVVAGRVFHRLVSRISTPERAALAGRVGLWGLASLSVLSALGQVGVDLTVFLGAAGLFTVAFGFAAQTSAANVISGLFLVGERPFSVGDFIRIGTIEGTVLAIDFLSVKLATPDNLFVRVPNESVMKSETVNFSRHGVRRIQLVLQLPYDVDLEAAERVLLETADAHPRVLDEPRPALSWLRFADSGVEVQLNAWAPTLGFLVSRKELAFGVVAALNEAGMPIPFPHVELVRPSE